VAAPFFDLYIIRKFFDAEACGELIAEMRESGASAALTYGKGEAAVDERVRRVSRISVSGETLASVGGRLEQQRESISQHFGINLTNFEEPQFLSYRVGDFFVAHQDGNTGLVNLDTDRTRRISVSIFLNDQSATPEPDTYGGGALVFSDWRSGKRHEVYGEAGMLVAFRSELTHEVTPVTDGKRFAIVSWYGNSER
jgi:predicted 2-oxoglutarate/Fe(II)-dependent dioxygenase YbiX